MQKKTDIMKKAFKTAFPHTIPIFAGFCLLRRIVTDNFNEL